MTKFTSLIVISAVLAVGLVVAAPPHDHGGAHKEAAHAAKPAEHGDAHAKPAYTPPAHGHHEAPAHHPAPAPAHGHGHDAKPAHGPAPSHKHEGTHKNQVPAPMKYPSAPHQKPAPHGYVAPASHGHKAPAAHGHHTPAHKGGRSYHQEYHAAPVPHAYHGGHDVVHHAYAVQAPHSKCGANLLVGCAPSVAHVPCVPVHDHKPAHQPQYLGQSHDVGYTH
ncbi:histidine-rich glycoprotein-like [Armigeres subalbatus]|uniref:histidine-rich glycoprotein-like n=1 Tax=Armigeres subalbatus TaxID=124917 RepID=UPI002ED28B66